MVRWDRNVSQIKGSYLKVSLLREPSPDPRSSGRSSG